MKKINYTAPRYVIPLIILPFLIAINWIVLDAFPPAGHPPAAGEAFYKLNTKIPGARLRREEVSSKFEAIREAFKHRLGVSAMHGLEKREETGFGKYYGEDEVSFDSLRHKVPEATRKPLVEKVTSRPPPVINLPEKPASGHPGQPLVFRKTPETGTGPARFDRNPPDSHSLETAEEREMRIWKAQMLLLDSLTMTPEERAAGQALKRQQETFRALAEKKAQEKARTVHVEKVGSESGEHFNTVRNNQEETFIKAIIDEDIKVLAGSRVRIRLMDDIDIGGYLLDKGSCIYARVSSFSGQRVYLTVGSILVEGRIRKVDLQVYDHDGIKGLYVPGSDFIAFAKKLGSNLSTGTVSGVPVEGSPGRLNQLLSGMAETGMQATGKAAARAARKNRARLKYNTILYLVNTDQT